MECKYVKGSSVIEMSYIIPLFLWMFVMIMHAVFYYHDKAVINGTAAETAVLGSQAVRRQTAAYDLEGFFRQRTDGKLIFLTDTDVAVEKTEDQVTVSVSASKSLMKVNVSHTSLIVKPEERIRWME